MAHTSHHHRFTFLKDEAVMSKGLVLHTADGIVARDPSVGILHAYGSNVPANATAGYAPGCIFVKTNGTGLSTMSYVNVGTKASASFQAMGLAGASVINYVYGDAAPIDGAFFTADRAYIVQSIIARPTVVGSDLGAVTAQVRKANNGVAVASGNLLHSSTINLKGTVDTNQVLALNTNPSVLNVGSGWSIVLDVTGTTTAARGVITVSLLPA